MKIEIQRAWDIDDDEYDFVSEVLYHEYETEMYEGYALTIFVGIDGEIYECNGSHCSCYGLDGQWEPEPTSAEALRKRIPTKESWNTSPIDYSAAAAAVEEYNSAT